MLKNYVLLNRCARSSSPSLTFPRIILFRPDGRLMLGIATKEDAFNYEPEAQTLERHRRPAMAHSKPPTSGAGVDGRRPRRHTGVDRGDGPECMACHGPGSRPIWEVTLGGPARMPTAICLLPTRPRPSRGSTRPATRGSIRG